MEGMDYNVSEMLQEMLPKRSKKRAVSVSEARRILLADELDKLIDMDDVVNEALDRVEQMGIIFLDELDKIAGERGPAGGPDGRLPRRRPARPAARGRGVHRADQVRHGPHRPHPVHRRRRVPYRQALRSHPRAAGAFPDSGRALIADRGRLREDPDRAQERPAHPVPRPRRDRRGGPRVRRERGRRDRPDRRRGQPADGEYRRPPPAHRPHHPARGHHVRPAGTRPRQDCR